MTWLERGGVALCLRLVRIALMPVYVPFSFGARGFVRLLLRFRTSEFYTVFCGLRVFAGGFDALFSRSEIDRVTAHALARADH